MHTAVVRLLTVRIRNGEDVFMTDSAGMTAVADCCDESMTATPMGQASDTQNKEAR